MKKSFLKNLKKSILILTIGVLSVGCSTDDDETTCFVSYLQFNNVNSITLTVSTDYGIRSIDAGDSYTFEVTPNQSVHYTAVTSDGTNVYEWEGNKTLDDCETLSIDLSI